MRFPALFLITISLFIFYTFLCVDRTFPDHRLISGITSIGVIAFIIRLQFFHDRTESKTLLRTLLVWTSSVAMGFWSSYIIFCLFIDCANLLLIIGQVLSIEKASAIQQTHWMYNAMKLAFIASLITSVIGLLQAIRGPVVRKVRVPTPTRAKELAGLKIVQISDLHIGAIIQKNYIQNIVSKVLALKPDIIAITGDIADGQPDTLREYTQPLAELKAPLGTYYITGNHEYYSGALAWIAEAEHLGFTPLLNENRILDYNHKKIMMAGVTDLTAHRFIPSHASDPFKAIASEVECDVKILLAHQPESNVKAQEAGFDIQLSGHTHAGQYFPFSVLVSLAKRYTRGAYRYKTLWIYVNPGTGFWGAANRFGIPAEITLLEFE